jgi:hypothetical protein
LGKADFFFDFGDKISLGVVKGHGLVLVLIFPRFYTPLRLSCSTLLNGNHDSITITSSHFKLHRQHTSCIFLYSVFYFIIKIPIIIGTINNSIRIK